jgi:hypothetical protein
VLTAGVLISDGSALRLHTPTDRADDRIVVGHGSRRPASVLIGVAARRQAADYRHGAGIINAVGLTVRLRLCKR